MENFRQKTEEEQQNQIESVEQKVGKEIIPPNNERLPLSQLKEKYPARYDHFVEILRSLKNPEYKPEQADRSVKMIKMLDNLQDQLLRAEAGVDKTLLPRQNMTLDRIVGFLEKGNTEGHVAQPTGIGKTVIFSKLLESATKGTGIRALVVGPTKIILHQNRWKLAEFGEIEAGAYYGSEKDLSKAVTVTTYASLRNGVANGDIDPKLFDMIILDEAHRALGPETVEAIDAFSEDVVKIGFTATPEFHEEKTVADILPTTIDEMKVREGIESSLLAGLKVLLVSTKKDISQIERKGREYDEAKLEKIINTADRNQLIVNVYKNNPLFNGKLGVVYCGGRTHAKDMTTAFVSAGVNVAYIDGQTSEDEREDIFLKYKNGDIKILCNAEVLIEGFDEPEAEVCINAAPTLSKVVAEQRGGRVLRRSRKKDNKIGYIVEVVDEIGESENTQVLYSEIAGAAEILPPELKKAREKEEGERKERQAREKIEVKVTNDIVDDPDLIMQLTNRNMRQRYDKVFEYAPPIWTHSRRLAHELGIREGEIRDFAEIQKAQHPEWVKKYLTSTDILTNHYSPELSNQIRRHFNPNLVGTITKEEYAAEHAIEDTRAEKLLSTVEETAQQKAYHFGDTAYYPKAEYEKAVSEFEKGVRAEEGKVAAEAEERFWQDDDRTDEEREEEYWNNFDTIQSTAEKKPAGEDEDSEGVSEHSREAVFHEGKHPAEENIVVGELVKDSLLQALNSLDEREKQVIIKSFFENNTHEEIAHQYGVTGSRIQQIEAKAIRKLRHRLRIGLTENPFETDTTAETNVRQRELDRERFRIEAIPVQDVIHKYQQFQEKIKNTDRKKDYIASWDKKYYDLFRLFDYSLISSDKEEIDAYINGGSGSFGKTASIFNTTGLRFILEKSNVALPEVSADGKMLKLYEIYDIAQTIRSIEEEIKNKKEVIKYIEQNKSDYDDWREEKKDAERELKNYQEGHLPRLESLKEYKRKYEVHFVSK